MRERGEFPLQEKPSERQEHRVGNRHVWGGGNFSLRSEGWGGGCRGAGGGVGVENASVE